MGEPADTMGYMIAGYVVIFGAILVYIGSLGYRWRRHCREIHRRTQQKK